MRNRSLYLLALSATLSACAAGPNLLAIDHGTEQTRHQNLSADLDAILTDPRLAGAEFALVVRDVDTGDVLYERNADLRLIPASTLKLLTSAAAFDILGPEHRFITDVSTDGNLRKSVLDGNIYLRGTGDPTISTEDYADLAAAIAAHGIRSVQGNLILDDTWFDTIQLGSGWAQDDEGFAFSAPISALTVSPDSNYGVATVNILATPGAIVGEPITVTMMPPNGYITLLNHALTGEEDSFSVQREHGTNRLIIRGTLPITAKPEIKRVSVWDSTRYVADIFERALRKQGVQVRGKLLFSIPTSVDAQVLANHSSMTLSEMALPLLKLSNNGLAEILTKTMGQKFAHAGTWPEGTAAIADFLRRNGIDDTALRQVDGSGLSRYDLVTAKLLTDLLVTARGKSWFDIWYAALPVAGNPDPLIGGTLSARMHGTLAQNNVHAKTGSMSSISGISGYVNAADGRLLAFSILENNYRAPSVKPIEDKIVETLAAWHAKE